MITKKYSYTSAAPVVRIIKIIINGGERRDYGRDRVGFIVRLLSQRLHKTRLPVPNILIATLN